MSSYWDLVTGPSVAWVGKREQNALRSPIYRIPRELLLEIMDWLDHEDAFIFRQVCVLFHGAFSHGSFSNLHDSEPAQQPRSISRLRRWVSVISRRSPVSVPTSCNPLLAFRRESIGNSGQLQVRRLLQKDLLCSGCRSNWPANCEFMELKERYHDQPKIYCSDCNYKHAAYSFPTGQDPESPRRCIAWEGRVKICPHQSLTWSTLIYLFNSPRRRGRETVVLDCTSCMAAFRGIGESPVIRHTSNFEDNFLILTWKVQVCVVERGRFVTRDVLRQALQQLDQAHPDLMCGHMSFEDMMEAVSADRCVCFREANSESRCYKHHLNDAAFECCACFMKPTSRKMGRFLGGIRNRNAPGLHGIRCRECLVEYEWTTEGRRIFIQAKDFLAEDLGWHYGAEAIYPRLPSDAWWWAKHLDQTSWQRDESQRHLTWCAEKKCPVNKSYLWL